MGWVDNNTVQIMTTRHHPRELESSYYLHPLKRHGIPEDSAQQIIPYYLSIYAHTTLMLDQSFSWPLGLPIPAPIRDYNLHMGGSDGSAQQRAVYSYECRSDRYWWPLFIFLLDAAAYAAQRVGFSPQNCFFANGFFFQNSTRTPKSIGFAINGLGFIKLYGLMWNMGEKVWCVLIYGRSRLAN